MDQLAILRGVTNAGKLLRIEEIVCDGDSPHFVVGIALRFERRAVYVEAQAGDDSLIVTPTPSASGSERAMYPVTDRMPWSEVCGQRCVWAWLLTNQQGCTNGLRLQFITQPVATVVEFVVAASQMHCCHFQAAF